MIENKYYKMIANMYDRMYIIGCFIFPPMVFMYLGSLFREIEIVSVIIIYTMWLFVLFLVVIEWGLVRREY